MFGASKPKFDANKTKVNLKMLVNRFNLLTQKKANLAKQQKRQIALLLKEDKEANARILVEHIIREDYTLESYDLLRQYTELLLARLNVVMVDADWNPATDHQAMARVYRQGQTKPCFVYRMFTTGTVEEVIYQRQMQKGTLAKMADDGGNARAKGGGGAHFSKEELRDCFALKEGCKCDTQRKLGDKWSDYHGASSLTSQGCRDGPLLGVIEADNDAALTFVRVVGGEEEDARITDTDEEDTADDAMLSSERSFSGDDESSSSEEEEFDE